MSVVLLSTKSIEDKFHFIDNYKTSIIINIPYFDFICIKDIYLSTTLYPFLFALISIAIFPYFERYISMPIWKKHQNKLKEQYAKLEKEEILLGSERDNYINKILDIRKEKNNLVEELSNIDLVNQNKIEKAIQNKEEEFIQQKKILNVDFEVKLQAKVDEIINQKDLEIDALNRQLVQNKALMHDEVNSYNNQINNKEKEILELKDKLLEYSQHISKLEKYENIENERKRLEELRKKDILKHFSIDEIKFLETIYHFNLQDKKSMALFINNLIKLNNSFTLIDAEKILTDLIKKGYVSKDRYSQIIYNDSLRDILYSTFNKQEI